MPPGTEKHTYFTILQIVKSAFCTTVLASQPGDLYPTVGVTVEWMLLGTLSEISSEEPPLLAAHPKSRKQPPEAVDINHMFCREGPVSRTHCQGCW